MTSLLRRAPRGVTGAQKAASSPRKPHKPRFRVAVGTGTDRKSHTRLDAQITSARSGAHNFLFSFKESLSCHFRAKKIKPHNHTLNSKLKRNSRDGYLEKRTPCRQPLPMTLVVLSCRQKTRRSPVTEELGHLYAQVTHAERAEMNSAGSARPLPGAVGTRTLRPLGKSVPSRSRAALPAPQPRPPLAGPHSLCTRHHSRLLALCHLCPTSPASPPPPSLLQQAQVLRTRRAHFQLLAWPF